jgi:uncharacterized protein (TIGR03437 family)
MAAGSASLPTPASVPVASSEVQTLLNYAVSVMPSVSWLDVVGGGTTPGSVSIALDPSASGLAASATPYQATVMVTCAAPSPCAGNTQTIAVSLSVAAPPPQLTLSAGLLSFSASPGNPGPFSQPLGLRNAGGGTLGIQAVTTADGWVRVTGAPGSLSAGQTGTLAVSADPTGLAPGYYQSSLAMVSSAGSASLPVDLLVAQNPVMVLNPAGVQLSPGNMAGSFLVSVSGASTVAWSAAVLPGSNGPGSNGPGSNWLQLGTTNGSSTGTNPGAVSFSVDPVAAAALAPGTYYGSIVVSSGSGVNSPLNFVAVLTVTNASAAPPNPTPAGLVFIASGGAPLPPQTVQLGPGTFQASVSTSAGGNWLSVSASPITSGTSRVTANPGALAPGIYTGRVSYAGSGGSVSSVNVSLIVEGPLAHTSTGSCVPALLSATQTALVNDFRAPQGVPLPLSVALIDNCGNPVLNGQVTVSFSNGDPPVLMNSLGGGIYGGTWTPRSAASQVTVSGLAVTGTLPWASAAVTGDVVPSAAPILTPHAALHVFDPVVGAGLAPGSIVQIYGSNLASGTVAASTIPLPSALAGTSVMIGGLPAPLYFVSPSQINAQAPFELAAGGTYQIQVNTGGALSMPDSLQLAPASPGVAVLPSGMAIAQHLDGTQVTETSPARPGETVTLYLAGLGITGPPVSSGAGSPANPLAIPVFPINVTLDGLSAAVVFDGLTPGLVGLYQASIQVPVSIRDGDLVLAVEEQGIPGNRSILPVHH